MKKILFIILTSLLFSCKQSQYYYVEDCGTITFYDTFIMPSNHVHHPDDTLCLWSDADTITVCMELPYKMIIPKPKQK
jgi:hypothetical protein